MRLIPGNFPDQVWGRLKAWAQIQAAAADSPTLDECIAYVHHVSSEIAGRPNALRAEVVNFYADETYDMVRKFREQLLAAAAERDESDPGLEPAV